MSQAIRPSSRTDFPVDSELGRQFLSAGFASFETGNTFSKGDGLVWAAWHGRTELVRQLLDHDTDVNVKSGIMSKQRSAVTALHLAALKNHCDTLQLLLDAGADTGALADFGDTPLHVAALFGHVDSVRILLEHDADPAPLNDSYGTPLHGAVSGGHIHVVDLLLHLQSFPLHTVESRLKLTPLDLACHRDQADCLELLLKVEADLNLDSKTIDGNRLCQLAAQAGSRECMRLLIDSGIVGTGPSERDKQSRTPFLHAIHSYQWEMAAELLECGSNVDDQDESGASATMIAATADDSSDFTKLLRTKNADFRLKNGEGDGVLHFAARENKMGTCRLLLDNGAELAARNHQHETPLLLAARLNHLEAVQQLITFGADIDAQDYQFRSGLTWAIYQGNAAMARLLLAKGANSEQKTSHERSPWRIALEQDPLNMIMVRLILDHGVSVNARVDSGPWTALHIAVLRCQKALVAILLEYGADPAAEGLNGITVWNLTSSSMEAYSAKIRQILNEAISTGKDSRLSKALGTAISRGRHSQTNRLLEEEFDINAKDLDGRRPLSRAAEQGNGGSFEVLMNRGALLTLRDTHGESPLWWACRYGHTDIVQHILSTNLELVNTGDADDLTPLMVACQKRHFDIVQILLRQASQSQLARMTSQGRTALHYAAMGGCPRVTSYLVDNGAILGHRCKSGKTPWDMARRDDAELLGLLHVPLTKETLSTNAEQDGDDSQGDAHLPGGLELQGATNETSDNESKEGLVEPEVDLDELADDVQELAGYPEESAFDLQRLDNGHEDPEEMDGRHTEQLMNAAINNRGAAIRRLVKAGANVNRLFKGTHPPIVVAVIKGNFDAVTALVENEAKVDWTGNDGHNVLHLAALYGSTSAFSTLLDRGCPLESVNNAGQTPLTVAAWKGNEEAVRALIDLGAKINSIDKQGVTPLIYAIYGKHLAVVEILLQAGADYQKAVNNGDTGFGIALVQNDRRLVKLFLERGYDVVNESREISPLSIAAAVGAEPVVDLLLEYGYDVNGPIPDPDGILTPLMMAAEKGNTTIVMMLVDAGASPDFKGRYGKTALSYAKDSGHETVVEFLYDVSSRQAKMSNDLTTEESKPPYKTPDFKYSSLHSETGIRILHLHPQKVNGNTQLQSCDGQSPRPYGN